MNRFLPIVTALLAAMLIGGCGESSVTPTAIPSSSSTAAAPTPTASPTAVPWNRAAVLSAAKQTVLSMGYGGPPDNVMVVSTTGWDAPHQLAVIVALYSTSGDGAADRAFFFYNGRFVGTDTPDGSPRSLVTATPDTVTLKYALYSAGGAECCPNGFANVRFRWDGTKVAPLDPVPSATQRQP